MRNVIRLLARGPIAVISRFEIRHEAEHGFAGHDASSAASHPAMPWQLSAARRPASTRETQRRNADPNSDRLVAIHRRM